MNFRRLAVLSQGWIALVPQETKEYDFIGIFAGGQMPFVVRPVPDTKFHEYIGEDYIDCIMNGESWDENRLEYIHIVWQVIGDGVSIFERFGAG